jgi:nitric oxide reductase activation protein
MSGHRLARNRLHRIRTGDPRLFLKKTPQKMVNTAVHVLLDNSGSMNDLHRFRKAQDVLLAMIKALGPISGVNLGVSIFPAFYPYYKTENINIPVAAVVKHHQKSASRILYPAAPNGGTPLGPSLRYVVSAMLGLSEPRKIIFIITDGDPDGGDGSELAIQEAVDLGFEVLALGIEELAHPEIFPHAEILADLQELPQKTFALLEKLLLRN